MYNKKSTDLLLAPEKNKDFSALALKEVCKYKLILCSKILVHSET